MKKRIVVLVALTALLSLAAAPMHAMPPINASGTWYYTPTIIGEPRLVDGNLFFDATSVDYWTGTFDSPEGAGSNSAYKVVIHEFVDFTEPTGSWFVRGVVEFVGKVDGKEGTLVMRFSGKKPDATTDWSGKWVIIRGTGELKNLRGQGTWWGPGAPAPGVQGFVDYSGRIRFALMRKGPWWPKWSWRGC